MNKTLGAIFRYPDISMEEVSARSTPYATADPFYGVELPNLLTGVENELESCSVFMNRTLAMWSKIHEGSLRGDAGYEYILSQPLAGQELMESLYALEAAITKQGIVPDVNIRTSTHVHINVRNFTLEQITNMLCTAISVECLLMNYVGKERENSSYAIPFSRRSVELQHIARLAALRKETSAMLLKNTLAGVVRQMCKYSSVNLSNLLTLGTIEFRMRGGCFRTAETLEWINIIHKIVRYSIEQEEAPEMLPAIMSSRGAWQYVHSIFEEYAQSLVYAGYEEDVLKGIREAQYVLNLSGDGMDFHSISQQLHELVGHAPMKARDKERSIRSMSVDAYYKHVNIGCSVPPHLQFNHVGVQ